MMQGDIIRRIGAEDRKGYVTESMITCYLQIKGTNKVITSGVSSRLLSDFMVCEIDLLSVCLILSVS